MWLIKHCNWSVSRTYVKKQPSVWLSKKNPFICLTGLKLLHELTARKAQGNFLRFDMDAANGIHGVDVYGAFSVGPSPGYQLHIGTRNSSLNLVKQNKKTKI